jgi:hypothetical protein
MMPALLSRPAIGRYNLRSRAAHAREIRQVAHHRNRVSAFSLYLLLQLVELFAIASYQYDFAVLDHFQCCSPANARSRAADDVRLVLG